MNKDVKIICDRCGKIEAGVVNCFDDSLKKFLEKKMKPWKVFCPDCVQMIQVPDIVHANQ